MVGARQILIEGACRQTQSKLYLSDRPYKLKELTRFTPELWWILLHLCYKSSLPRGFKSSQQEKINGLQKAASLRRLTDQIEAEQRKSKSPKEREHPVKSDKHLIEKR